MAFYIDTAPIRRIPNYTSAKEWFEYLTPVRGGDQSVRRIGNRKDDTKWLKHELRDGVDVYVAGFHSTELITYYPTHYKLSMRGWVSTSTRLFVEAVMGVSVHNLNEREYVPQGFTMPFDWNIWYNHYPIVSSKVYEFDYDHKPLTAIEQPVKYKVNRKRMNEVRKVAKPFYTYIDTMHNLMDDPKEGHKSRPDTKYSHASVDVFVADLPDQEAWWDMFQALSFMTEGRKWVYGTGSVHYRQPKAMKQVIERALKATSNHVLDVVN